MTAPELRRDAARNRDRILAAARSSFDRDGLDVGVEAIAHRAGVGVGTLYRRFPTKEALVEAVLAEVVDSVLDAAERALASDAPGEGLVRFLWEVARIQADHAGCLTRLWSAGAAPSGKERVEEHVRQLLVRAQDAGSVRADIVYEDVALLILSLRGVIEATAGVAPGAWERHLELLLASLAPSAEPLSRPPLTSEELRRTRAGWGHARPDAPPRP